MFLVVSYLEPQEKTAPGHSCHLIYAYDQFITEFFEAAQSLFNTVHHIHFKIYARQHLGILWKRSPAAVMNTFDKQGNYFITLLKRKALLHSLCVIFFSSGNKSSLPLMTVFSLCPGVTFQISYLPFDLGCRKKK